MKSHIAAQVMADGKNIFEGVTPSFGPFSNVLDSKLEMLLALVWLGAFFYAGFHLIVAIAAIANSMRGGYGNGLAESGGRLGWAAGSLIGLASVAAIYWALVS